MSETSEDRRQGSDVNEHLKMTHHWRSKLTRPGWRYGLYLFFCLRPLRSRFFRPDPQV